MKQIEAVVLWVNKPGSFLLKNRLDDADKVNDELLTSQVQDQEALLFRGEIQLRRGEVNGAIQTLESVVAKNPDVVAAHYQLGLALGQQGELDRAAGEWKQAVRIQPPRPIGHWRWSLYASKTCRVSRSMRAK